MHGDSNPFASLNQLQLPDLWQQEAVHLLRDGVDVVIDAPTGAGKTYVFELFFRHPSIHGQAVYTVPTRALANEKFLEWRQQGLPVGIATGDLAENLDAPLLVATLETQRERILNGTGPALLVIDEYQMLADQARGLNYELAIARAPLHTQLLLLSGSVANPGDVVNWIQSLGRKSKLVQTRERPIPLDEAAAESTAAKAPGNVSGFFQRLAFGACIQGLAPLLIFTPQRKLAEKTAKLIAATLPDDIPLNLPSKSLESCPRDLRPLLTKRVAFHHSGLPYSTRAGIVEPLAKRGMLRVVVATMGLAAGINFSVRSVFVSSRTYYDGPFQIQLSPDELLQMFGRAGRRGLDEAGTVLTTANGVRLNDARPLNLRRSNALDWPTFLRVMDNAATNNNDPFAAAASLCHDLFSQQDIILGFEKEIATHLPNPNAQNPFSTAPTRKELLDSNGQWKPSADFHPTHLPLARCMTYHHEKWQPALQVASTLSSITTPGRPCKLTFGKNKDRWRYGIELPVARILNNGKWRLTKPARSLLHLPPNSETSPLEWQNHYQKRLLRNLQGFSLHDTIQRGEQFYLRIDPSNLHVNALVDPHNVALLSPPERTSELLSPTAFHDPTNQSTRQAHPGSPLHAWLQLQLINANGHPTQRGKITSFFQRGEGLGIAAAIEDPNYHTDDIVWHLANLRGGHRFANSTSTLESEQLGAACRRAYGSLDFPGYLELGLPSGYGEGAADTLIALLRHHRQPNPDDLQFFSLGDLERARVEWLSLLRHINLCPNLPCQRWSNLKSSASHLLNLYAPNSKSLLQPHTLTLTLTSSKPPNLRIHHRHSS